MVFFVGNAPARPRYQVERTARRMVLLREQFFIQHGGLDDRNLQLHEQVQLQTLDAHLVDLDLLLQQGKQLGPHLHMIEGGKGDLAEAWGVAQPDLVQF